MVSATYFAYLQNLFYTRLSQCCNPVEVSLKYFRTSGGDKFTNFTGDNNRLPTMEFNLHCLYQRDLNDKQREKLGVNQNVTDVIYISPLELQQKTGSNKFPEEVRNSYAMISVEFLGKHFELLSIKDLEPVHNGMEVMCIAYQLNLRTDTGNRDYN